jgi:hypothetical protein
MRNLDSCRCWRCRLCPCKVRNKFLVNFWNCTILFCIPCIINNFVCNQLQQDLVSWPMPGPAYDLSSDYVTYHYTTNTRIRSGQRRVISTALTLLGIVFVATDLQVITTRKRMLTRWLKSQGAEFYEARITTTVPQLDGCLSVGGEMLGNKAVSVDKRQSSPVTGLEWPRGFQEV